MKSLPRGLILALVLVLAVIGVLMARQARMKKTTTDKVAVEAVSRRDITVSIEATGTVEPIDLVEVKSKASGQITRMPVQVGSFVKKGALLAQIDTRDVKNQYDQALAALRAAQASANVSKNQNTRANDLFAQQVITAPEHEAATLDYANAQAQLIRARTDLDLARQRLEDATVSAPITGTVLQQLVTAGQVITSATSGASAGTSLLQMADLSRIRLRGLVSETDIGSVHPGQVANVTVDAFPNRAFEGRVEKIEPQAVVQQSVTMFPVLIAISNEQGLLLPGMNGEVSMLVDQRSQVLAVPVDAVRSAREVPTVAVALGLDPDSVRAQVGRQVQALMAQRMSAAGDSGVAGARGMGRAGGGGSRGGGGDSTLAGRRGGRGRFGGAGADSSRASRWQGRRGTRGGGGGGAMANAGGGSSAGGGFAGAASPGGFQGGAGGGGGGFVGGGRNRAQVVFVKTEKGLEPRVVRMGLSDFDYAEVISGLSEGDQVALLGVAEAQAQRTSDQQRVRQRMGGGGLGVPGTGGGAGGGRPAGGGGTGGGGRPGGS